MNMADRAQQNREFVRTLLREKQPHFAAVLESVGQEPSFLQAMAQSRAGGTQSGRGSPQAAPQRAAWRPRLEGRLVAPGPGAGRAASRPGRAVS